MAAWHGERGSVSWPVTFASLAVILAAIGLALLLLYQLLFGPV